MRTQNGEFDGGGLGVGGGGGATLAAVGGGALTGLGGGGLGLVADPFAHQAPDLELDHALGRNLNLLQRARILRSAGSAWPP